MKTIYLAGGCFWCIEYFFRMQEGIISVTSGYSGGDENNPSYEDVKAQKTGHRETIEVIFEDKIIPLEKIIDIYFSHINPLDKDGQFGDNGHSYTLAMYYQNEEEKALFTHKIEEFQSLLKKDIYIAIEPFKSFYKAEEHHQNFACKNPFRFNQELKDSGRKK